MPAMRILATLLFTALLCLPAMGQDEEVVTGYDCECLIDGVSVKQGTLPPGGGNATWQIDGATLSQGMHQVQMRVVQHLSSGVSAAAVYESLCYRMGDAASHEVTATCRVDGQVYRTATVPTNGTWTTWTLDLSDIAAGLHHVNVMIADKDRDGLVTTTTYDAMCYRPGSGDSHEVTGTCLVDGQVFKTSTLPTDGSRQTWVLDLASLPEGLHHVQVNIVDKDKQGIVSTSVYQAMCYIPVTAASHEVTATCWVDGQQTKQQTIAADGKVVTWALDWSDVPVGLHHVQVVIADKDKQGLIRTSVYRALCYRMGYPEDHVVAATFWVNGQQVKQQEIKADGEVNTIVLNLSYLHEGTYPIRVEIADTDNQSIVTRNIYESEFYCYGYEMYDVNGDGSINVADASVLVDVILDDDYSEEYDMNGDGVVNISDVNLLIAYILGR